MNAELISILFTIIFCNLIGIVPIIVIVFLIYKSKKNNIDLMNKTLDYKKMQEENKNPDGINKKKIVRCGYCGRQSRFNDGKCPHCGAELEYK